LFKRVNSRIRCRSPARWNRCVAALHHVEARGLRRRRRRRRLGLRSGRRAAIVHRRPRARRAAREQDQQDHQHCSGKLHHAFPAWSGTKRTGSSAVSA
jgi:hypothetical protein